MVYCRIKSITSQNKNILQEKRNTSTKVHLTMLLEETFILRPCSVLCPPCFLFQKIWSLEGAFFINLNFGGYLAGTTPMLSIRSSPFVLCRNCFECVRTAWLTGDFLATSVGAVYGKHIIEISHTYRFPNKKLHGTYSFDGDNHQ